MATKVTKSGAVFVDGVRQWGATAPTAGAAVSSTQSGTMTYNAPPTYTTPTSTSKITPLPSLLTTKSPTIGNGGSTTPIVGNINGGGSYANNGLNTTLGNSTIGSGNLTTPIVGNINGGGSYANNGLSTSTLSTPRVDPIGANIAANPNYQSPAVQQSNPQLTEAQIMERINAGIQAGLAAQKKDVPAVIQSNGISELINYFKEMNEERKNNPYNSPYNTDIRNTLTQMQSFKPTTTNPYESKYGTDIRNTLTQMQNFKPTAYDPNSDQSLKIAQDQAKLQVINDMAKRGRVFDTYTDSQMQQGAQRLIPQYEQLAYQRNNDEYNRIGNTASALSNAENQAYNQYQGGFNNNMATNQFGLNQIANTANTALGAENQAFNQYQGGFGNNMAENQFDLNKLVGLTNLASGLQQTGFNQGVTEAGITGNYKGLPTVESKKNAIDQDLKATESVIKQQKAIEDSEKNTYGIVLSDKARQSKSAYDSLQNDEGFLADLKQYSGNLALLREEYKRNGDNEGANAVEGARLLKILNDPTLLETYGASEFGLVDSKIKEKVADLRIKKLQEIREQLKLEMDSIDYNSYDEMSKIKLEKAYTDLSNSQFDNYIKNVNATFVEEEKKQDLINKAMTAKNIQDQIDTRATTTTISQGHLDISREKAKEPTKDEIKSQFAKDYSKMKGMGYDDAYADLIDSKNREIYINNYGYDGYVDLYNSVLVDAFNDKDFKGKIKPLVKVSEID